MWSHFAMQDSRATRVPHNPPEDDTMAAAKRMKLQEYKSGLPIAVHVRNPGGNGDGITFGEMEMPDLGFVEDDENPLAWHREHSLEELVSCWPSTKRSVDAIKAGVIHGLRTEGNYGPYDRIMVAEACRFDFFCLETKLPNIVCPLTFPYKTDDRATEIERHAADMGKLAEQVLKSGETMNAFLKGIKVPSPSPPWKSNPVEWQRLCVHGLFVWSYSKLMRVDQNWELYRRASERYRAATATFNPLSGVDPTRRSIVLLVDLDKGQKAPGALVDAGMSGEEITPSSLDGTPDPSGRHGMHICNIPGAKNVTSEIRDIAMVAAEAAFGFAHTKQVEKAFGRTYAIVIPGDADGRGRAVVIGVHMTAPAKDMTSADFVKFATALMRTVQRQYDVPTVIFAGDTNLPEGQDVEAALAISELPGFRICPDFKADMRKSTKKMRIVTAQYLKRRKRIAAGKISGIVYTPGHDAEVTHEWTNPDEMLPSLGWPLDHSGLDLTVKLP